MAAAGITVIPTGGSVPIDLADLAQTVANLQAALPAPVIQGYLASYSLGHVQLFLLKQTRMIETPSFFFDGSSTALTPDTGPLGAVFIGDVPDGLFPYGWSGSAQSSGSHSILITTSATNATTTVSYTVP